jgi:hypothetical protein
MSNEIDDAKEWTDLAEMVEEQLKEQGSNIPEGPVSHTIKAKKDMNPGQPTQYALYGSGYTATTATVDILPSGSYDVFADDKCVYVTPSLKPSGLLLELPEMRSDDVIKMVESFWNSEKDYKEGNEFVVGGAAFKAGIMLFGPPGSGKSKTIQIVTNKLVERGGTVFHASGSPSILTSFLHDFATIEPNRKSIVILEDIDSLIEKYREAEYLELLDSAKTINNVLFIATTNYPERLEPRIYCRPGRFSHVIKIGLPTAKAREAYLKAILKNHRDVEYIVANTEGFTIDHLTALANAVYREGKELKAEITRLRTLFKVPKAEGRALGIGRDND